MTPAERNRAFRAERQRRLRARLKIQRDTVTEITRLLRVALERITGELAAATDETAVAFLSRRQAAVRQVLAEIDGQASARLSTAAGEVWEAGIALVDAPLAAGGIRIAASLGEVDTRQLTAMRAFMTDRIRNVTVTAANAINAELGLTVLGAKTPGESVTNITRILKSQSRGRAITIVRTELGRAFATAAQARMDQARETLPGLRKQWRRSGKTHSRVSHDQTDGQVVDIDERFTLAESGTKLRFPRDPRAPARETINCGCESLPYMEHWEVKDPGERPFTAEERRAKRAST